MKEEKTIYGILAQLCLCRKLIRCKVHCCYSDGKDCSLFSISFYQSGWARKVGEISFCGGTGKVKQYYYKNKRFSSEIDIVDLLLDLYSFEKEALGKSANQN